MRAAASLAINGTGADPAAAAGDLRRDRFIRITDDGLGANALLMSVFPVTGVASFEMHLVALAVSANLPRDDADLQLLELSLIPAALAVLTVATPGQAELVSRVFAPGWYYCRQLSSATGAKRADLSPIVLSAATL